MKLNLFLVILAVLLLSNLGLNVKEYFEEREGGKRHFDNFAEYDTAKDRDAEGEYGKYGAYGEKPLHVTEYERGGVKHNKRLQDDFQRVSLVTRNVRSARHQRAVLNLLNAPTLKLADHAPHVPAALNPLLDAKKYLTIVQQILHSYQDLI